MSDKKTYEQHIEEYLANGGKITVAPPVEPEEEKHTVPIAHNTYEDFNTLTLGDASLIFPNKTGKAKKKKKKDFSGIDVSILPPELQAIIQKAKEEEGAEQQSSD